MVIQVKTKKIDADTHFTLDIDYQKLKDLLPRSKVAEAQDMMWRDAERFADPNGVRATLTSRDGGRPGGRGDAAPDPARDPEARIAEMDRLGFDMQVLNTQRALPAPLRPADRPLWLRTSLAQLYNDAAAELQSRHPDRYICQVTVPWDDIDAVREGAGAGEGPGAARRNDLRQLVGQEPGRLRAVPVLGGG